MVTSVSPWNPNRIWFCGRCIMFSDFGFSFTSNYFISTDLRTLHCPLLKMKLLEKWVKSACFSIPFDVQRKSNTRHLWKAIGLSRTFLVWYADSRIGKGQQQAAACTSCDWSLWSPSRRREDCAQGVQEPGERKETSLTKELEEQNRKESKWYYGKVY